MRSTTSATPPRTGARRLGAVVGPALLGAFVLASCGDGDSGATQSTIDLNASSTAFVVRPPATTEPPADSVAGNGTVVEGTQEYEVQAGDYPFLLVDRFEVSLEDLLAVNEWSDVNQFPGPGTVILIPPGGLSIAEATAAADDAPADDADAAADPAPTETIPEAGDNCGPGSYTIEEGDYEGRVATAFDVTVDALRAANASTQGYTAFYPGLEIVIPAKADC